MTGKEKVFVIGGAGYIGGHVARELLDHGYEVGVYDNLSTGSRENLFSEASFVEGDILDKDKLVEAMRGYDAVIHLAALKNAGESMRMLERYTEVNIGGSRNVLEAATELGIKKLVFSSSAAVYGNPKYTPMDEEHPAEPANHYGKTKLIVERLMKERSFHGGPKFAALRYFNAAGYDANRRIKGLEKNPGNLIPIIMEVALGKRKELEIYGDDYDTRDGTGVRDYISVTDLAVAHRLALDYLNKENRNLIVNLGTEHGTSVKEILDAARRITGREIPTVVVSRREGDVGTVVASYGKAQNILGWKPENSNLEKIIRTTWEAYQRNFSSYD